MMAGRTRQTLCSPGEVSTRWHAAVYVLLVGCACAAWVALNGCRHLWGGMLSSEPGPCAAPCSGLRRDRKVWSCLSSGRLCVWIRR